MTVTISRRQVSALAKLDFEGKSHAQRIDAIAKAIGYGTAEAMMGKLRQEEQASPDQDTNPSVHKVRVGDVLEFDLPNADMEQGAAPLPVRISFQEHISIKAVNGMALVIENIYGTFGSMLYPTDADNPVVVRCAPGQAPVAYWDDYLEEARSEEVPLPASLDLELDEIYTSTRGIIIR